MKKTLILIFTLLLALSMCACEGVQGLENLQLPALPDVDSTAEPSPSATAAVEDTQAAQLPLISAYYKSVSEESYDPAAGEKLILSFSYDDVSFHIDGGDAAAAAINEYLALVNDTYYTGNDYGVGSSAGKSRMLELAEDNYRYAYENNALDMNLEYSSSRTAEITRADGALISVRYSDYVYTGGTSGDLSYVSYVFDTATGSRLTLDDLSSDPDALRQFLAEKLSGLVESQNLTALTDAELTPDSAEADTLSALFGDGTWYFDGSGLALVPQLDKIGEYDLGLVEFTVPYSDLSAYIDSKWLPSARNDGGELTVKALEDIEDGTVEIVDKVTVADNDGAVDSAGSQICVIAQGSVYDVLLSRVEYSGQFYETGRVWYCSELRGSAVQIVTSIPEGMPDLMISYRTADGQLNRRYISVSGVDGSVILVDDGIEAVG